jgi:5'-nucleotidase
MVPSATQMPSMTPAPSVTPAPAVSDAGDIGEGAMTKRANPNIKEYTVQEGEGLWQIAEKVYGDGEMFNEIMKANKIQNPDQIYVGMKLKMPHTK